MAAYHGPMRVLAVFLVVSAPARAANCHLGVMIVLDRSCSMELPAKPGGTQTRWELVRLALQSAIAKYSDRLDFGLIMFSDQVGDSCVQDGPIYFNVAPGNGVALVNTVMSTLPASSCATDVKPAIDQVSLDPAYAMQFIGWGRQFVLFISSGGEHNCGGDDGQIAASIQALYDKGYPTYVVGFGDDANRRALDQFAIAGGVPRRSHDMGSHLYYQLDEGAKLDPILDQLTGNKIIATFWCPYPPCPDGRCYDAPGVTVAAPPPTCIDGYCQPRSVYHPAYIFDHTGSTDGSDNGSAGDDGGASGDVPHRAIGGCGCELAAAPVRPLALLLLGALLARRRIRSR
jgi:von Willebrand factor type A domain